MDPISQLFQSRLQKAIPDILYHYCSLKAFFDIIDSHSLRLSNGLIMNDYKEQKYFYDLCRAWYEEHAARLDVTQKKAMRDFFALSNVESCPFFCLFLCQSGNILSQWRGYGDDGRGVAIGFNLHALGFQSGMPGLNAYGPDIKAFPIEYDEDKQLQTVDKLLSMLTHSACDERVISEVVAVGAALAISFKHPGFREEQEWRLAFRIPYFGDRVHFDASPPMEPDQYPLEYGVVNKQLISYFTKTIAPGFSKETLPQIYVGPRAIVNPIILKMFLEHYQLQDIGIEFSNIPYR